jgi:WS/DGAT/MGAT family acyltransferase
LLFKTHHALVDGISGVDIATVLFDAARAPAPVAPPEHEWIPQPLPSDAQLLADALLERATVPKEIARGIRATLRGPRQLASRVGETLTGLGAMAWAGLSAAPPSPFNVRIGPHRRFTWVQTELSILKGVKDSLGGTVNDVVLAAVTGALSAYMRRHGHETEELTLKAMVPVSVRADIERGALGNRVAAMWAPLPVGMEDPVQRLLKIRHDMHDIKESGQAVGAQALTRVSGFAPPTIMAQAARLQARQRLFNLVVTNVPGPQRPLYLLGRELESLYPLVPLAENTALGIAVVSYNGQMNFGLNGDYDALADLDALADDLRSAINELTRAAGVSPSRRPARAARGSHLRPVPAD